MDAETPIYHKCGQELIKRSYKKYGQRGILVGILIFPLLLFIGWGTIIPYLGLLFFVATGVYFLRKKPGHFYLCPKCRLKIQLKELDSGSAPGMTGLP